MSRGSADAADDADAYLTTHDVEGAIATAVARVLRLRPDDPLKTLGEALLARLNASSVDELRALPPQTLQWDNDTLWSDEAVLEALLNHLVDTFAKVSSHFAQLPSAEAKQPEDWQRTARFVALRLATIEDAALKLASKSVPRPQFAPVPAAASQQDACAELLEVVGNHSLHKSRKGIICLRCLCWQPSSGLERFENFDCVDLQAPRKALPLGPHFLLDPPPPAELRLAPSSSSLSSRLSTDLGQAHAVESAAAVSSLTPTDPLPSTVSVSQRRSIVRDHFARVRAERQLEAANRADARSSTLASVPQGASAWAESLPDHVLVLPAWLTAVDRSHVLLWVGGFAVCTTCGGTGSTRAQEIKLLRNACRGWFPKGSKRLFALRRGRLPVGDTSWPDERAAPSDVRRPISLRYDVEGQCWRV